MPYAETDDSVRLYYEEAGTGTPILFAHEFGGDHRTWEAQMRHFSRRHRCITFSARGYLPSDVPKDFERYSQERAAKDIRTILDHLTIDKAHVVGLSMGGTATLNFGLDFPERALSLVIASAGSGSDRHLKTELVQFTEQVAKGFLELGSEAYGKIYAASASRVQLLLKDPRGFQEFATQLGEHSALGSANTMRGVVARRPSVFDLEERMRVMPMPVLIVVGDEDELCIQPSVFMKKTIPASGLLVLPKTGHLINLEEPEVFNNHISSFIALVEAGKWTARDQRTSPTSFLKLDEN